MYDYYCPTCKKAVKGEEVEIVEVLEEGDFEECHSSCSSKLEKKISFDFLRNDQ